MGSLISMEGRFSRISESALEIDPGAFHELPANTIHPIRLARNPCFHTSSIREDDVALSRLGDHGPKIPRRTAELLFDGLFRFGHETPPGSRRAPDGRHPPSPTPAPLAARP